MNWMIFTKMFRGISLGTTPRDPLGKSVVVMVMSRLEDRGGRKKRKQQDWLKSSYQGDDANFILVPEDLKTNKTKKQKKTTSALSIGTITLGRDSIFCFFLFLKTQDSWKIINTFSKCCVPHRSRPCGDAVLAEADASGKER